MTKRYVVVGSSVFDIRKLLDTAWQITVDEGAPDPRLLIKFTAGAQATELKGAEATAVMDQLAKQLSGRNVAAVVTPSPAIQRLMKAAPEEPPSTEGAPKQ